MSGLILPFAMSMVRHALTLFAGGLAAKGYLQADQVAQFVGSSMFFIGLGLSFYHKLMDPAVLAGLADRVAEKNLKAKELHVKAFPSSPLSVLLALAFALAVLAPPVMAQDFTVVSTRASKGGAKILRIVPNDGRMDAGLVDVARGALGGQSPIEALFDNLKKASIKDLEYAKVLADTVGTCRSTPLPGTLCPPVDWVPDPKSAARSRCYGAWLGMMASLTSSEAALAGDKPSGAASLFTRFEQMAQVADNLAPLSSFQQACTPVAQALKMNITQFALSVVTGGIGLGTLGILP